VSREAQEATGTPRVDRHEAGDQAEAPEQEQPVSAVDATRFAHASEAEMARILDFYQVRWDYEPTTFPILWNLDGEVVESFAPDFYLPDLEVFLEMTTLKQRLVRKKNRKLRRLRELYPDIRIKLFYARDFRAMMLKYGRLGLAASLSGTLGQVVPERTAVEPIEGLEAVAALGDETIEALAVETIDAMAVEMLEAEAQEPGQTLPSEPATAIEPTAIEAVIPVGEVVLDVVTPAEASVAATSPPVDLQPIPAVPRAKPRTRSARRRRRAAFSTHAGAEREAGA
jgi:hypothetical protein